MFEKGFRGLLGISVFVTSLLAGGDSVAAYQLPGGWGSTFPSTTSGTTSSVNSYYCASNSFGPGMWNRTSTYNDPMNPVSAGPTLGMACTNNPDYDCPLFENRPHEALNLAIETLSSVMTMTPECQSMTGSLDSVSTNTAKLREALKVLQGYMSAPGISNVDPAQMQTNITTAITSASNLGQIFSTNSLMQSRCGREVMGTGKTLLALNDLLSNLSPYALMAAASSPNLDVATRFAITGGALATSTITSLVSMVAQGTVDMNNPEHRRAVLKNTCLFTKIARKTEFLALAQSGQIKSITSKLDEHMQNYRARFASTTPELNEQITYREGIEKYTVDVETRVQRDAFEISALESDLKEYGSDPQYVCLRAVDLAHRSIPTDNLNYGTVPFPLSVISNLDTSVCLVKTSEPEIPPALSPTTPQPAFPDLSTSVDPATSPVTPPAAATPSPIVKLAGEPGNCLLNPAQALAAIANPAPPSTIDSQIASLKNLNDFSRRRVLALEQKALSDDGAAIALCATTAQSWFKGLRQISKVTSNLLNAERTKVDEILAQSPEYAAWREQKKEIKAEEQTISRVSLVLKQLENGNSVIDRSELDQRMRQLKSALFGYANSWSFKRSPILEWLNHTMRLHMNRVSSLAENIRNLQAGMIRLKAQGSVSTYSDFKAAPMSSPVGLDSLNLDMIPIGTPGHRLTCQIMKTAWLDWSASIDHMGAVEFMCALIEPYLTNDVEEGLVDVCRGDQGLDGRQVGRSQIQNAKARLISDKSLGGKSYKEWALALSQKIQDMQCPMPVAQ